MRDSYDIVIIGGGVIGASVLWNLKSQGFEGSIGLFERGDALAEETSAKSAGAFRNLWGSRINMEMATYSIGFLKTFETDFSIPIGFHQHGYLFTFYPEPWERIKSYKPTFDETGVKAELLSPEEVEKMVPGLKAGLDHIDSDIVEFAGFEPIAGGLFGPDCGSFDPSAAAKGYIERAQKEYGEDIEVHLRTEVKRIQFDAGKVKGVELADGSKIGTSMLVLAAGPWSAQLLSASGLQDDENLPYDATKRQLFVTNLPDIAGYDNIPLVIIDRGIYFKYETGNLQIGRADPDQAPGFDQEPSLAYYKDEIGPYMQERIPGTEHCNVKSMWGGLYSITRADHNGILGQHPAYSGLYLANGWSGHGAMVAPAASLALAELIVHGSYKTIDAAPLRFERFAENDLVVEDIVI
ncbi:FAD-dependent oxidoreductase [candidate division WOR-3 bacterium]|uniref:FAD-dependent oxidoreductase n=1 Tax=candidate division WOR-3 bacterium TaxID=2052148 RepID=A0A9D5QC51_UNCW3|nr:FAD-dependent oxidoreductase [candidate division WOR-3 bacterium]MBD3364303.1 FAD-dependent oxidoreductase [candidate division WOR-3 bacterium]